MTALNKPNEVLQKDQLALFPELPTCPSFGGYFNVITNTENLINLINDSRKEYRGSKLGAMDILSTPDYLDVEMSK